MTVAPPTLPPLPYQPYPGFTSSYQHTSLPIASLTQHNLFLHESSLLNQHRLRRLPFHTGSLFNHEVDYSRHRDHEFKKPLLPLPTKLRHARKSVTVEGANPSHPHLPGAKNMDHGILSSISYSESESLHDGAFDMSGNLNMSDSLLSSNASINTPSSSFDLFDGDTDYNIENAQDLRISPHNFVDSGAGDFEIDDEDSSSHSDKQFSQSLQSQSASSSPSQGDTPPLPDRPRGKGRPAKVGGPLGRHGATCPVCAKHFNNSSALAKHKLTHSDERKYVCRICSKAFKRQDHLNGHMMTHESKKPFACKFDSCDKSYCDARSLRRHIENHHQQDVESLRQLQLQAAAMAGLNLEAPISSNSSSTPNMKVFPFEAPQPPVQQYPSSFGGGHEACRSPGYLSQVSPISPAHPTSPHSTTTPRSLWAFNPLEEPKPVQCTLCHRRFKNIPALNGHMRLHGGYFKRDGEQPVNPNITIKTEEASKTELMPPPPPKKDIKKQPIIIMPSTSSIQSTMGVSTVNTTMVVLATQAETTMINAGLVSEDFDVDQTLATHSDPDVPDITVTGSQTGGSLQMHSSGADILGQHMIQPMSSDAVPQIHQSEGVPQIHHDQSWQDDPLGASDDAVEHAIFGDHPASATDSNTILGSAMQGLADNINSNIMDTFNQVGQGSMQGISDTSTSYQPHHQFMGNQQLGGYQGNMTTMSQRHMAQHPVTPLDSPSPHTPHPATPAHALTPNHPITPKPPPQPLTPHTPHTPNPHTPNHPLTPTHRQQQQSRYFLFPPQRQLENSLTPSVFQQGDQLQSPHPHSQALRSPHPQHTQALHSPHPNVQALQSPHPQHTQALQSPHPQHTQPLQSPHPQHTQPLQSPHPQHTQPLQSPHPQHTQPLQSPHPQHHQNLQSPHPHVIQSSHPHHTQALQSPHPQAQHVQQALQSSHPLNSQALQSPHPQALQQQPHPLQSPMHPPHHQPLPSPMPQTMLQNSMAHGTPLHSPMPHQISASSLQSSMQQTALHSPMPQNQVQLQSPLPQHHTPLQSPLPQSQNLQQQHHFNFGHHQQQQLQRQAHFQQQQQQLQQQKQEKQQVEIELQQHIEKLRKEDEIQQVERKLLEDLENMQHENLQKQQLHEQQQQQQLHQANDFDLDLPIIQLQPPPPPRYQRQQQQQQQHQQSEHQLLQQDDNVVCKTEDVTFSDRSSSNVSDNISRISQIIDTPGDLSDHIDDILVLNLPHSMRDIDGLQPDRKRRATTDPEQYTQHKRPCVPPPKPHVHSKPNRLVFKTQDSSDSDKQDVATEHDEDDTEAHTDDSQPSGASRPSTNIITKRHKPRSGKQMRLIEAANRQCAGGGNCGSSKSSSTSSESQGGSGAGASTPPNSGHSTSSSGSSSGGSSSSGGASNGGGAGGGNPDDGVFRNPNIPATPMKGKKKHRPEPLIIPPHVNHFGFASRLRSPRLWEGTIRGMTPPPYTPPPMLSPVRSGAGLFWTIQTPYRPVTPKSAPITPRFSSMRRASLIAAATPQEMIPEETEEPEVEPPPETDIQPHVNIGEQYQAPIPDYIGVPGTHIKSPPKEVILWDPEIMQDLTDEEIQYYQDFACCAAIPGNGTNKEYALHLLYICKGNIKKAMLRLMQGTALVPENHTLKTYKYQESDLWTTEEIDNYHQGLIKCDKDFFTIAKQLGSKTVKQCIQFYYLWKKVCTDEYRKLRQVRRKREQEELYNLRSRTATTQGASEPSSENTANYPSPNPEEEVDQSVFFSCEYPGCTASFNSKQALNGHNRIHGGQYGSRGRETSPRPPSNKSASPGPPSNKSNYSEEIEEGCFPCKICGRVFTKIKSRNAHMKSHRQEEADHKTGFTHYDENT